MSFLLLRHSVNFLLLTMLCQFAMARASLATEAIAESCDHAAMIAAQEHDVPIEVLRAITRTETGRAKNGVIEPWPWTVNMEGDGHWFATEDDAKRFVFKRFKFGARSFDVGCFQINYRWHGHAFESIDAMFEPLTNARYAASFLADLFREFGDWPQAAGAFHSRTEVHATRYAARFSQVLQDLPPVPESGAHRSRGGAPADTALAAGAKGALGSLMPVARNETAFIAFSRRGNL